MPLKALTAATLAKSNDILAHGFFTRQGGVSKGIYDGLNCGPGSADDLHLIQTNRAKVAAYFSLPTHALCTLDQVHSTTVAAVTESWGPGVGPQADAMVTNQPGVILGILTADCAPLLFADQTARVIGAAHAGWKGALSGVVGATLDAMERLGAKRDRITAAIGPCIAQSNYEVGPEFKNNFLNHNQTFNTFFSDTPSALTGHVYFDLAGFVEYQIKASNIAHIERSARCTYAESDNFFSYRRTTHLGESDYGRQISAIVLR